MGIYILFYLSVLISSLFDKIVKGNFFKIIAIFLAFGFLSFRYNNGWDYHAYYNTIEYGMYSNILGRGEFLNILLINISRSLGNTFIYFFVSSLIQIFCISYTLLKYSKNFWMSFIFYLSFPLFYLNSFSVIRMFTAVSIIFFGTRFLIKKNILFYLLCVFLAVGFHKTAYVALIFPFLYLFKQTRVINALLLVLIPSIATVANTIVQRYFIEYAVYFNESSIQEGTRSIQMFVLIYLLVFIFLDKFKMNKVMNLSSIYFLFGLIIYITFFKQGTLGHRLSLYGTIYSTLIISDLYTLIETKYKTFILFLIYIVLFVLFLYSVYVGKDTFIPYNYYFNR